MFIPYCWLLYLLIGGDHLEGQAIWTAGRRYWCSSKAWLYPKWKCQSGGPQKGYPSIWFSCIWQSLWKVSFHLFPHGKKVRKRFLWLSHSKLKCLYCLGQVLHGQIESKAHKLWHEAFSCICSCLWCRLLFLESMSERVSLVLIFLQTLHAIYRLW